MSAARVIKPDSLSGRAPVFVLQRHYQQPRRSRKCRSSGKKWFGDGGARTWDSSSTLTSFKYYSLLVLMVLTTTGPLCSSATDEGAKNNAFVNSVADYPKFNLNDLANLMDMFPEFREYVLKTLTNYAEQQQQQGQLNRNELQIPSTTTPGYHRSIEPNFTPYLNLPNSRKDAQPQLQPKFEQRKTPLNKLDYYDSYQPEHQLDYHPQPQHHHVKGYDKGYGYSKGHHNSGWSAKPDYGYTHHPQPHHGWSGWSPEPEHHHEIYKDPHYHYQVGYELGKDVSCVLGLLGFKSWKDFTFHGVVAVFKKLKYIVLIGIAFKLGILLSPVALPILFPVIIIAAIIKILPLLLVIKLLFKLLKTQLKLKKFGIKHGRENYWKRDDNGEGTQLSRLWESIEEVTGTVMDSESCMEKVICKISRYGRTGGYNQTVVAEADQDFEGKSMKNGSSSFIQLASQFLRRAMDLFMSGENSTGASRSYTDDDDNTNKIIECEKIPCSIVEI